MSSKTPKKTSRPKIENEVIDDEQSVGLSTPLPEGTDPSELPFPEFCDQDVIGDKWDVKDKVSATNKPFFEDSQRVNLPDGLIVDHWKRPMDVYINTNLSLFTSYTSYPDLVTVNQHLMFNEFYRTFISTIQTLLYIGNQKPLTVEFGHSAFATSGEQRWKPWDHIYSNSKLHKGDSLPTNILGKYIVRLFWMGAWRRIYVDDLIPFDKRGNVLIPLHQKPVLFIQEEVKQVEKGKKQKPKAGSPARKPCADIWPIILCKALLKLYSMSMCRAPHVNQDFDMINCLTGWVPHVIKTNGISVDDLWDILMVNVNRYYWPPEEKKPSKGSKGSKSAEGKNKPAKAKDTAVRVTFDQPQTMPESNQFVVMGCDSYENIYAEGALSNRVNLFIGKTRTIPLVRPPPRPEIKLWQTHRYEGWAEEQGIIPYDIDKLNIKSLKIIDPFDTYQPDDTDLKGEDILDKKTDKSKKSSKLFKSGIMEPDPSKWIDFAKIHTSLKQLTIYYQASRLKTKYQITDVNYTYKLPDFQYVIEPYILEKGTSEPLYMFMDSCNYKTVIVNLSQIGDTNVLENPDTNESSVYLLEEEVEEGQLGSVCEEIILAKSKPVVTKRDISVQAGMGKTVCGETSRSASVVFENYDWTCNELGEPIAMMSTCGTKTLMLNLKPGRFLARIWISSPCSYVLQVLTDSPLSIGCLEVFLAACGEESHMLNNLSVEISSCLNKLVQSFGSPDYSISLRNFYACYKPHQQLQKKELASLHQIFLEELFKIFEESTYPNAMDAVKLLFLQLRTFEQDLSEENDHLNLDKFDKQYEKDYAELMQRKIVTIQAFFKRIYIRLLMRKTRKDSKAFNAIHDTLKKVEQEIFPADRSLSICQQLVRRIVERKDMKSLISKFEVFKDMDSVLYVQMLTGNTIVPAESPWIFLGRYDMHILTPKPIVVKIDLFCNIKAHVRVYRNDTLEEVKRIQNNVIVAEYCNFKSYTILCYASSEGFTKVNWKLTVATKKTSHDDLIKVSQPKLTVTSLQNQYMPNCENLVCRYIFKVKSDALTTFHINTSYDQVKLWMRLRDENGFVIANHKGVRNVMLPVFNLRFAEENEIDYPNKIVKPQWTSFYKLKEISYSKVLTNVKRTTETEKLKRGHKSSATVAKRKKNDDRSSYKKRNSRNSEDLEYFQTTDDSESKSTIAKRRSSRSSRSSASSKSPSIASHESNREPFHTKYILEVLVMDDSWPLTLSEWSKVETLRQSNYLNLLLERKTISSMRSRKSLLYEEPYWVMNVIYHSDEPVEILLDNSISEKRKLIKSKWFADVDKYRQAMEMRNRFLAENLKPKEDFFIDKTKRSNNQRDFAEKAVPALPYDEFMMKPSHEIDEELCKVKRDDDYIQDEANIEAKIRQYQSEFKIIRETQDSNLQEQFDNFDHMNEWFEEVRLDSAEAINEAVLEENEIMIRLLRTPTKQKKGGKRTKK